MKKTALTYAALFVIVPLIFLGLTPKVSSVEPVDPDHGVLSLADPEYIGATRCRTCHRSEEAGEQFPKWEASAHSKAFTALASDAAKAIAAEKGLENAQTAPECLQCHVTAFGVDASLLGARYDQAEGVSCEACHGAGGDYYKKATMEGITKGEIDRASVGLVKPDEALCRTCHNENSPTFKGFDFEEYKAKIAHPIPAETKAAL